VFIIVTYTRSAAGKPARPWKRRAAGGASGQFNGLDWEPFIETLFYRLPEVRSALGLMQLPSFLALSTSNWHTADSDANVDSDWQIGEGELVDSSSPAAPKPAAAAESRGTAASSTNTAKMASKAAAGALSIVFVESAVNVANFALYAPCGIRGTPICVSTI